MSKNSLRLASVGGRHTPSRTDILKRRVTVYVCAACWQWHERKRPKSDECHGCGNREVMIRFDSKTEANYAGDLRLRLQAGLIRDVTFHPKLIATAKAIGPGSMARDAEITYTPDARFFDIERGVIRIVDVKPKGNRIDPGYEFKRKLFSALTGIEIETVHR